MKLIDMVSAQRDRLAMVDTSSTAFKVGVVLRTLWELSKPILFLTALFFAIGIYFTFVVIVRAVFGYNR